MCLANYCQHPKRCTQISDAKRHGSRSGFGVVCEGDRVSFLCGVGQSSGLVYARIPDIAEGLLGYKTLLSKLAQATLVTSTERVAKV